MPVFLNPTAHKTVTGEFPTVTIDDGWPDAHLLARPGDEVGQSIINFARLYRGHPNLQPEPWDPRTGKINLIPPDEVRPSTDEVPR